MTAADRDCVHPSNSLNQNNTRGTLNWARMKLQKNTCGETEDVDTQKKLIHIRGAKGKKDRYIILSEVALAM